MEEAKQEDEVEVEVVVDVAAAKKKFPYMNKFISEDGYEEMRSKLMELIFSSGILDKNWNASSEAGNPFVLLYDNMYNSDYGILKGFETPRSATRFKDVKRKIIHSLLPGLKASYEEYINSEREPPLFYVLDAEANDKYQEMMKKHNEKMKQDKEKKSSYYYKWIVLSWRKASP